MTEFRTIPFMRIRLPMAVISLLAVLVGMVALATKGLNLGLDFTGGTTAEFTYQKAVDTESVREGLEKGGFKDVIVQYGGSAESIIVRMPPQKGHATNVSADLLQAASFDAANPPVLKQVDSVGSQVGDEMYEQALIAVFLSLAMMMLYVAFRFRWKFAVGATISLLHDTLFTVGVFAIFGWPFDLAVLAAVLALIGYSLNDTIVVFDRIRENFRKLRKADPVEVLDISLTETLRRTIMTVTTVVLVVLALLLLGGEALKWFSVALLVGLFAGTYSSIYIATSYALWMGLSKDDFLVQAKSEVDDRP